MSKMIFGPRFEGTVMQSIRKKFHPSQCD